MTANSLLLALALSLLNGAVYFIALYFSWDKSNRVFFAAFYGTFFWKLAVFTAASLLIFGNPAFNFPAALIAMVIGSFLSTILSVIILQQVQPRGF